KVTADRGREEAGKRRDVHSHKPGVLSLSQATESGTVYTVDELRALGTVAHELGLRVHIDGARFANAVAALGVAPKALTWEVGVDVLCFGGTKNGMAFGDAVVFFDRALAEGFEYVRKQAGPLPGNMRHSAAPGGGWREWDAWL